MRNDCFICLYTDDCLCFSLSDATIDTLIQELREDGFLLKDEGDVNAFLGVDINRDVASGKITMSQPGLIDQILVDLGLLPGPDETPSDLARSRTHRKFTPVTSILHQDPDGQERRETWNYRSVIGKMSFLAQMTRADIAFAVHQCARFSQDPKLIHEKAVKYIGRYLLATRSKGLILTPSERFSLDAYCDSDFAGRWHHNYAHLRDLHLSRTGYVTSFCGCPIFWKSKLQTEIALSSTEAETIALSQCLRELIPMRTILSELSENLDFELAPSKVESGCLETPKLPKQVPASTVYEDTAACIVLATSDDQYRARTKHISIKWWHFKDHVRRGLIKVEKVNTDFNWSDILTKPLSRTKFEGLRKMMMGW